ncbi:MAG: acyl-CoA dehydrogenase [Candidatus Latescibacteria bacterium]|nr:acyl-CoA dehydrogenase [Candidatus Latescibacterota bacterium]NIM21790.1 acyl-CoA dehydrogenase [Candidatus Latescibacterota bacterium]NIM65928.1 acyl-CoA dehydrogenase [Candidatus Latescibacterota bacterium]NIO02673.1 acyl-CoA dehydrogenase [Candidatus Latescibacterota bacterium]NIO29654.1 acyl-CoA dehydrogenase [Candidatus Latescibacterota bacterium]
MAVENKIKGGSFLIEETEPAAIFSPEGFSEEQRMFAKTAEDFVENEVLAKIEETEAMAEGIMAGLLKKAGELGLLMIDVPEKFGGLELDKATSMLVSEIISKGGAFASTYGTHTGIGTLPLVYFGTDEQKQKYLPRLATGEIIGCYALTEAGSGSDALAAKARAELSPDGKYYVLNGEKMFVTNGGFADLCFVFAKINGEDFSCFIVELDYEGVSTGAEEKKMGIKGSSTVAVILEDAKIPAENLLGEPGKGHKIAFNILNIGRFKLGVGCVGGAKHAFRDAVRYSKERHQFGRPLCSFGLIKNKIANMAAKIYVTESMSYRTAGLLDGILAMVDKSSPDAAEKTLEGIEEFAIECSIMKVKGSEILDFVVDEAVQIFGGYGYMQEYPVERYYRDSRIARIYEGTSEINRLVIPGMLIKRAMKGELPLMAAAKKLQSDILEFPALEEAEEGFLAEETRLVVKAKKAALLAAGTAFQKYMDKISEEQGILGDIADILIEIYGMESALLRTLKIASEKGEEAAAIPAKLTCLFIYDALGRVNLWAKEVLAASADGDELRTMLTALRRFTRFTPPDTLGLRVEIADDFVEKEEYVI